MRLKSRLLARLFSSHKPDPHLTSIYLDQLPQDSKLSELWFKQLFEGCADVRVSRLQIHDGDSEPIILIVCEGLADMKQINEYVIPRLIAHELELEGDEASKIGLNVERIEKTSDVITRVFSGELILYVPRRHDLLAYDISDIPDRQPEEANTELSVKGPRDGFVENMRTNVALVRKRLRTNRLRCELFRMGQISHSNAALLYIDGYIRNDIVEEARRRIHHIKVDSLVSSAQLEELLTDSSFSLFPLTTYTGRPDFVVECLLRGRLAIIVDGAPIALIAPVNLTLLLKSPEDQYFPAHITSFHMGIRLIGLLIALFLPGFWIALSSYNLEQLPFPLLATVATTRIGLPIPGPIEAFMMLALFEIFREAAVRLPKAVGQTVAVVGGIIVGDAVIRAGLASTTMLIITALTAVATFTLVNQTLSSSVTLIRLIVMATASLLGMYGFILASIAIVVYLSKLESFGVPYLTPLSPLHRPLDLIASLFKRHQTNTHDIGFLHDPVRNVQDESRDRT